MIVFMPIVTVIALFMGLALPFIASSGSGRGHAEGPLAPMAVMKRLGTAKRKPRPQAPGTHDIAIEYLYVPCVRVGRNGDSAHTRRWVQEVPIVRKTAKLIYYTSDSRNPREAVVSPGCISREQFETDTRCHDDCPHGEDQSHHGYPAGVIPIPCDLPGQAGWLFFATREAAQGYLDHRERDRAEHPVPEAPSITELRRAMAAAHPDRGGTTEQFIQAHRRYQTAVRVESESARASGGHC